MGNLARELPRFAYMPFGGGPRICTGQRFALIEAVLVLTTMAQRFSMEWQPDRKVTPFPSITLRPHGGVWLKIKGRRTLHRLHETDCLGFADYSIADLATYPAAQENGRKGR